MVYRYITVAISRSGMTEMDVMMHILLDEKAYCCKLLSCE